MLCYTYILGFCKKTLNKSLSTNDGVDLSSIFSDFWVDFMQSWQFSNEISNFIGIQIQIFIQYLFTKWSILLNQSLPNRFFCAPIFSICTIST